MLGLEPFQILASSQQGLPESVSLRGIEEDSPLFEHHGFGYLKEVKRLDQEKRDLASREQARSQATYSQITGLHSSFPELPHPCNAPLLLRSGTFGKCAGGAASGAAPSRT